MTVTRVFTGVLPAVLALLLAAGTAGAGIHIEYVDGLVARRYYDLAVEHLEKMRGMTKLDVADRMLIPLRLGSICASMGERETDPQKKEALLARASKYLDEFAVANPNDPQMLDVSLQQVNIQSSRAQALQLRCEGETDAKKKAELLKQVEELYGKALAAGKVIVEKTTESEKVARQKFGGNPQNKKFEAEFMLQYGSLVRGMFLLGHLEYLWAQLYPEKSKERQGHLNEAVKHFEATSDKNPKTNVTYDAHVRRGMCLRELAPYASNTKDRDKTLQDAVKAFDVALTVQSTPETKPTRAEANYQKALTALATGDFETAVTGVEGFLRESLEGKNSFRGQMALLLKAEALGKLAYKQLKQPADPEQADDWEGTYNQARSTLRDILPSFISVRQKADELIQSWVPMFPQKAEVVISPLIAASMAQKAVKDKDYPTAIEKYREVIRLSQGHEQFASFEEEAWKTMGSIYYQVPPLRLYRAAIAWKALIDRFPDTAQGAELAWLRTEIYAYLYTHSKEKDAFDLKMYLESLEYFIDKFPRDEKVFEAQTEIAKVYGLRGELLLAARIWSRTDPANPRHAESMLNAGELYRQAFIKLADQGEGDTPTGRKHLDACVSHLKLAADAQLPPGAKENYNAEAIVRLAELLVDKAVPTSYAKDVPPLLDAFRERFGDDKGRLARVMLATARADATLKQYAAAEKLALELEKDFGDSDASASAVQLMIVMYQTVDPAKANEWRKKKITDPTQASDAVLGNAASQAWKQKEYDTAAKYYAELVRRFAAKTTDEDREKLRLCRRSLAEVYFDWQKYELALPIHEKFLADARVKLKEAETAENLSTFLIALARTAECQEMGGDAKKGVELWEEFSVKTFRRPNAPKEWYEARYHVAHSYFRLGRTTDAMRVLQRVEVFYGGFKKFPDVQTRVEELKKKLK